MQDAASSEGNEQLGRRTSNALLARVRKVFGRLQPARSTATVLRTAGNAKWASNNTNMEVSNKRGKDSKQILFLPTKPSE